MTNKRVDIPTQHDLDLYYGKKMFRNGVAFKFDDNPLVHYYIQRENDVLHICPDGGMINTLHVGFFNHNNLHNRGNDMVEISEKEFNVQIKRLIYEKEFDQYWHK